MIQNLLHNLLFYRPLLNQPVQMHHVSEQAFGYTHYLLAFPGRAFRNIVSGNPFDC